MLDRQQELIEIKKVNLSMILASFGWEIDKRKSTRASVAMTRGAGEKVIVTEKKGVQVFCSVHGNAQGTAIDYVQQIEKPGASLGEVRQVLRPFLNGGYVSSVMQEHRGSYVEEVKASVADFGSIEERFAKLEVITGHHDYLCNERGIPAELLASDRLRGMVRSDPKYGSACFPHYTIDEETNDRVLCGWEIKGKLSLFASGGVKGLWLSRGGRNDDFLGIGEAGVDACSVLALRGWERTRVASLGGKMNGVQPKLMMAAMDRMEQGVIASICDQDQAGEETTRELEKLFRELRRNDLSFSDERPVEQGMDYNDVLKQQLGWGRDALQDLGLGM